MRAFVYALSAVWLIASSIVTFMWVWNTWTPVVALIGLLLAPAVLAVAPIVAIFYGDFLPAAINYGGIVVLIVLHAIISDD